MSIDQCSPDRRATAERATEIIKACIAGVALSVAIEQYDTRLVVAEDQAQ